MSTTATTDRQRHRGITLPHDDAEPHCDPSDDPFGDDVLELNELQRRDRYG